MARVLRPGGRLAIADIVTDRHLTDAIVGDADLWAYEFISPQARSASTRYGVHSVSPLAVKSAH